jgi:hypothetical protein
MYIIMLGKHNMESEKISKIEAACRQLNTAIKLWFADGDLVSIHTLACSAHQIVHDINRQKGGREMNIAARQIEFSNTLIISSSTQIKIPLIL